MAEAVKLRWAAVAVDHLRAAHNYLAAENAAAAEQVVERVLLAVEMLQKHPFAGCAGRVEGTRELVMAGTPFIVVCQVRGDLVEILAVFHTSRRWPDTL